MKRICEDYKDYGGEKDITDYILDVENNTLLIHTLCIIKDEWAGNTNKLCKLTAEQTQLLDNMSEKDCKEWCLKYQWELPEISRERKESDQHYTWHGQDIVCSNHASNGKHTTTIVY